MTMFSSKKPIAVTEGNYYSREPQLWSLMQTEAKIT